MLSFTHLILLILFSLYACIPLSGHKAPELVSTANLTFHSGLARIIIKDKMKKDKMGFVDKEGRIVIAPQYDFACPSFQNGYCEVCNNCDDKMNWFHINLKGEKMDPPPVFTFPYYPRVKKSPTSQQRLCDRGIEKACINFTTITLLNNFEGLKSDNHYHLSPHIQDSPELLKIYANQKKTPLEETMQVLKYYGLKFPSCLPPYAMALYRMNKKQEAFKALAESCNEDYAFGCGLLYLFLDLEFEKEKAQTARRKACRLGLKILCY